MSIQSNLDKTYKIYHLLREYNSDVDIEFWDNATTFSIKWEWGDEFKVTAFLTSDVVVSNLFRDESWSSFYRESYDEQIARLKRVNFSFSKTKHMNHEMSKMESWNEEDSEEKSKNS